MKKLLLILFFAILFSSISLAATNAIANSTGSVEVTVKDVGPEAIKGSERVYGCEKYDELVSVKVEAMKAIILDPSKTKLSLEQVEKAVLAEMGVPFKDLEVKLHYTSEKDKEDKWHGEVYFKEAKGYIFDSTATTPTGNLPNNAVGEFKFKIPVKAVEVHDSTKECPKPPAKPKFDVIDELTKKLLEIILWLQFLKGKWVLIHPPMIYSLPSEYYPNVCTEADIQAVYALNPLTQEYLLLDSDEAKELLSEYPYLANQSAVWIKFSRDCSLPIAAKTELSLQESTLFPGYNLLGVTPDVEGKTLKEFKGDCELLGAYAFNQYENEWQDVLEEKLSNELVGQGIVVYAANEKACQFSKANLSDLPPALPPIGKVKDKVEVTVKVIGYPLPQEATGPKPLSDARLNVFSDGELLYEGLTNETGKYSFTLLKGQKFYVDAFKEGFTVGGTPTLVAGEDSPELSIDLYRKGDLEETGTVKVLVYDALGKNIFGAEVEAIHINFEGEEVLVGIGSTEGGSAVFENLVPGTYFFDVSFKGLSGSVKKYVEPGERGYAEVTLYSEEVKKIVSGKLLVNVFDGSTGKQVPAFVEVYGDNYAEKSGGATSSASFELPAGKYTVLVQAKGFDSFKSFVEVLEEKTTSVDAKLAPLKEVQPLPTTQPQPTSVLESKVLVTVYDESKKVVPGITVSFEVPNSGFYDKQSSNEKGYVVFYVKMKNKLEKVVVTVDNPYAQPPSSTNEWFELPAGESTQLQFQVASKKEVQPLPVETAPNTGIFELVVSNEKGSVLSNAFITVYDSKGNGVVKGVSNKEGVFTEKLLPDTYTVLVQHELYSSYKGSVSITANKTNTVPVKLISK